MTPGKTWHIVLTRLVPGIRGGRWLCGAAIFGALTALFMASGVYGTGLEDSVAGNRAAAMFFSVIIAYIVPVFHLISERTAAAVGELARDLEPDTASIERVRSRIYHKPRAWFLAVLGIGCGAAIAHNSVLAAGDTIQPEAWPAWLAMVFGTSVTWIVLTFVMAALIDNALQLNRLAGKVRLNPLSPERLRPFASVAVLSTLSIVGAQAAFPIMIFDAEVNAVAFVPGLIATVMPMIVLALLPIWPLHRRLRIARQTLLAELNRQIAATPIPQPTLAGQVDALLRLLAYRRELEDISEWPFDMRIVGRLVLYLIIPPLTWVGAALIENVVDGLL